MFMHSLIVVALALAQGCWSAPHSISDLYLTPGPVAPPIVSPAGHQPPVVTPVSKNKPGIPVKPSRPPVPPVSKAKYTTLDPTSNIVRPSVRPLPYVSRPPKDKYSTSINPTGNIVSPSGHLPAGKVRPAPPANLPSHRLEGNHLPVSPGANRLPVASVIPTHNFIPSAGPVGPVLGSAVAPMGGNVGPEVPCEGCSTSSTSQSSQSNSESASFAEFY